MRQRRAFHPTATLCVLAAAWIGLAPSACGIPCNEYDACGEFRDGTDAGASGTSTAGAADGGEGAENSGGLGAGGVSGEGGSSGEPAPGGAGGQGGCDGEEVVGCTNGDFVFVASMTGSDSNDGTASAPLRTLQAAILQASETGKSVIACTGVFEENVVLRGDAVPDLFGGFDCSSGWRRTDGRTTVRPVTGVPLRIDSVSTGVLVEGFEFEAADALEPGESSVAAIVTRSEDVVLTGVRLAAGNGADGANGAPPQMPSEVTAGSGNSAQQLLGASAKLCTCGTTSSRGGGGGDGGAFPQGGEVGLPEFGAGMSGAVYGEDGTTLLDCARGGGGTRGADAPLSPPGESALDPGSLTEDGAWVPAPGALGPVGVPGQGGGGGRGGPTGGGGGGGCGGCGGEGGKPGQGGGGSFGAIVFESVVAIVYSEIETRSGGRGGAGAPGQEGQPGGPGGDDVGNGCYGGDGGTGGKGGSGGGGAGGSSVGILLRAGTLVDSGTTFALGEPGDGGPSGDPSGGTGIVGQNSDAY